MDYKKFKLLTIINRFKYNHKKKIIISNFKIIIKVK